MSCISFQNTGQAVCPWIIKNTSAFLIVPKYNQSGTLNEFATEAAVLKSAIIAKLDASDIDNRFFYLGGFKNYTDEKSETIRETFGDNTSIPVQTGSRTVTLWLPQEHPYLVGKLNSFTGQEFGLYLIDKTGNFVYATDVSTGLKVQPIPVDGRSWDVKFINASDTTVAKIEIVFNLIQTFDDSRIRAIAIDDLDFDGNSEFYGLLDASVTLTSTTLFEVTATIKTKGYNTFVKGLVDGDFVAYNVTDSVPLTIDSVTESSDGVYVFDLTSNGVALASAETVRITTTKARYDFGTPATVVSA